MATVQCPRCRQDVLHIMSHTGALFHLDVSDAIDDSGAGGSFWVEARYGGIYRPTKPGERGHRIHTLTCEQRELL